MPVRSSLNRTKIPIYPVAFMRSVGGATNYESTAEAPASNMHAHSRGGRHDRGNFQRRGMNENRWGVKAFDNLCLHFFKLEVGCIQRAPRQVLMLRQRATADLQALLCTNSMRVRVRGYLAAVVLPNCSPKGR